MKTREQLLDQYKATPLQLDCIVCGLGLGNYPDSKSASYVLALCNSCGYNYSISVKKENK